MAVDVEFAGKKSLGSGQLRNDMNVVPIAGKLVLAYPVEIQPSNHGLNPLDGRSDELGELIRGQVPT